MKRTVAILVALLIVITTSFSLVTAEEFESNDNTTKDNLSYDQYSTNNKSILLAENQKLTIKATDFCDSSKVGISKINEYSDLKGDFVRMDNTDETTFIKWKFNLEKAAKMNIKITYLALENNNSQIDIGLKVNGSYPFVNCKKLSLFKLYKNETNEFIKDSLGNQKRSESVIVESFQTAYLSDKEGITNKPYEFMFNQGENEITIEGLSTDFILKEIELETPEKIYTYQDYLILNEQETAKSNINNQENNIVLEAEKPTLKSNSSIIAMEDRANSKTSPSDPVYTRYNTIGGYNWVSEGQWIYYEFDVKESGYYNIGMRVKQNFLRGYPANRKIYIDGKLPFSEMEQVEFDYNRDWYFKTLGEQDDFKFYFEKGKHSIAFEIVPGKTASLNRVLTESIKELNSIYRSIVMITSTTPDVYRDYCLSDEIPNLNENIKKQKEILKNEFDKLQNEYGRRDSDTATLERLVAQLDSFLKDSDNIIKNITSFNSNISSLSSFVVKLKEQPLLIDYIEIKPQKSDYTKSNKGFFSSISFSFKKFIGSFVVDYNAVGDIKDKESLNVWVSLGRDQAQLIREIIDNSFKDKNIPVSVKLSNASLIRASYAGMGPDVALYLTTDQPVNLAVRGALVNLSDFKDSDDYFKSFTDEELVGFKYKDSIYGVPLTADATMMFVRNDIFKELSIDIPKTWDDIYKILPILQRNNMNIGLPKVTIEGLGFNVFNSLLFQNGQNYYTDDLKKTTFDNEVTLNVFKTWTSFYSKYGVPIDFDFYNRFRSGEIPIGVDSYTLYNKLSVAAPEISGLWTMLPMPGTLKEDGSIDRSTSITCTAGVILNDCKNKDDAWEFLKFFCSADTQSEYGRRIEALLGSSARYNAANFEAIKSLPWTNSESNLILEQLNNAKGIPQSIASYYVIRNIFNAYRKVTVNNSNPREVLYRYNDEINQEIKRKMEEFGLD